MASQERPPQDTHISIVIPHLNQEQHLERCLSALASQAAAMPGVEIIVVDNGSRDLPTALCARFPDVTLCEEKIAGPGPARNKGIAVARSDVLLFIDADCRPHPDWLRSAANHFRQAEGADIVGGDVRIDVVDPENTTKLEAYESVFAYRQKQYIEEFGFSGTGNLAMRRRAYDVVGPFAGIGVAEDRDWGQRATAMGLKIQYLPGMIVFHPARRSMAELRSKWDRHVSHDFEQFERTLIGTVKWLALCFAVAVSGIIDIRKIVSSNRISSLSERLHAAEVLFKIRLYRSWRMLSLLVNPTQKLNQKWNRS